MAARTRTFWMLSAAMGVSTVGRSMLSTAVPLFAVVLGLAPLWVGALVALPNALPVVLGMSAGRWVDRGGPRRWLTLGLAGMASAPALLFLAPGVTMLAAAQVLIGLFQLFAALASQSYVADIARNGSLERDYASYATLLSAGRLVGPILVGVVIDAAGFRPAFAVATATALLAVAMVGTLGRGAAGDPASAAPPEGSVPESERSPRDEVAGPSRGDAFEGPDAARRRSGFRGAWANVGVQLAVLSSAGVFVAISARQAFLPVVLENEGYTATSIGTILSLGALASVLVRPFMPVATRALGGAARALVAALAVMGVAVGALGAVSSYAAFVALSVAGGAATGVGLPLSIVTVAQRVGSGARGAALGLRMASNRAAQLVTPVLVGGVIDLSGFGVGFAVVGAVLVVLAWQALLRVGTFERSATPG